MREDYGIGYYQDVQHVSARGLATWGPKPEVTAAG